jgi:hypothetical protein
LFGGSVEDDAGKSGDEHRRENRNYLVGANRTFDLAGSLPPIGAPLDEVVILRGFQLFERIAASIHNAFNRVIASRAHKQLLLVTKTVIRMRTASCQMRPLANAGTLVYRLRQSLATEIADSTCPPPHASNRVGMWLEIGSRANKIASLVGPSAAAAKLLSKDEARRVKSVLCGLLALRTLTVVLYSH